MCLIYSVFNPNNIKKYGNILINIISLFYMYVCLYVLGSKTTPTKNSPSRCVNCSFLFTTPGNTCYYYSYCIHFFI